MPSPRAFRRHRRVGDRGRVIHHGLVSDDGEGAIGWIREIVMDSSDPLGLAASGPGCSGGEPVQWYPGWITLEPPPRAQRLSFLGTAAGDAPAADGGAGLLVHFDVLVSDLAAAHDRAIAAGAVFAGEHVSPRPGPGGGAGPMAGLPRPRGSPVLPGDPLIPRRR
jgi:hypothetical protein